MNPCRATSTANLKSTKGFTLVEMAIVLVIIGIAMALGLPLIGQLSKNIKYSDSRDIVKGAIDSVSSWAAGGSLQQLPDLRNTTSDFRNIVKSPSDAFGQPLIYVYDYNSSTFTSNQLCGIRMTSITLNYSVGSTNYSVNNVAFVVLSPGDDYKINSTITATNFVGANNAAMVNLTSQAIPSPGGTTNAGTTMTINADAANDIVQWVTIDELRTKIGCQSAQLTIVNNELPYGYNNTPYTANIYATGGVPYAAAGGAGQYKWCVQPLNVQNYTTQTPYNMSFQNNTGATNIYFNSNCQGNTGSWTQSDYIAISNQPIIIVTGSDNNSYISISSHVSGTSAPYNDQPITGANYATYWKQVTAGTSGGAWTTGTYYLSGSNEMTIFAMDNGNNTTSKNFTFTVNPF